MRVEEPAEAVGLGAAVEAAVAMAEAAVGTAAQAGRRVAAEEAAAHPWVLMAGTAATVMTETVLLAAVATVMAS